MLPALGNGDYSALSSLIGIVFFTCPLVFFFLKDLSDSGLIFGVALFPFSFLGCFSLGGTLVWPCFQFQIPFF